MKIRKSALVVLCVVAAAVVLAGCGLRPFSIQGVWKVIGGPGYGQAQPGETVLFTDKNCGFYSPFDDYTLTKQGSDYQLSIKGPLDATSDSFVVRVTDNNHISIYRESELLVEMQRLK